MKRLSGLMVFACVLLAPMQAVYSAEPVKVAQDNNKDWANPGGTAVQTRGSTTREEALFVEKCSMCHREMGMGTVILSRRLAPGKAMLEQRDDLSAALIQGMVRAGGGNMPRLGRGEVSDEQLEVITRHLLRKQAP